MRTVYLKKKLTKTTVNEIKENPQTKSNVMNFEIGSLLVNAFWSSLKNEIRIKKMTMQLF